MHKEFNLACISCHTTGWDEPGGASLARNEELRDVQCEVCHGPGSLHADAGGEEKVKTIVRSPAKSVLSPIGAENVNRETTAKLFPGPPVSAAFSRSIRL